MFDDPTRQGQQSQHPKGTGVMFINSEKQGTQPDLRGHIELTGDQLRRLIQMGKMGLDVKLQIAGWWRQSKSGTTFMSCVTEAYMKDDAGQTQQYPQQGMQPSQPGMMPPMQPGYQQPPQPQYQQPPPVQHQPQPTAGGYSQQGNTGMPPMAPQPSTSQPQQGVDFGQMHDSFDDDIPF